MRLLRTQGLSKVSVSLSPRNPGWWREPEPANPEVRHLPEQNRSAAHRGAGDRGLSRRGDSGALPAHRSPRQLGPPERPQHLAQRLPRLRCHRAVGPREVRRRGSPRRKGRTGGCIRRRRGVCLKKRAIFFLFLLSIYSAIQTCKYHLGKGFTVLFFLPKRRLNLLLCIYLLFEQNTNLVY